MKVKSPMLVCVGMYLPLETTFAIFIGGLMKGLVTRFVDKGNFSEKQKITVENMGILLASGLIAGEALVGLIFAGFAVGNMFPTAIFSRPSYLVGLIFMGMIGLVLVALPLNKGKNSKTA
jgi:hypothetical protein